MYLCTFWFIIYVVIDLTVSLKNSDLKTRIFITPHIDKDGYHTGLTCNVEINKSITFYVIWVQTGNEKPATATSDITTLPPGYRYLGTTTQPIKSKEDYFGQETCTSSCNYSMPIENLKSQDKNTIVFCFVTFKDHTLQGTKSEKVTLNVRKTIDVEETVKDDDKHTENNGKYKAETDVNINIYPELDRINKTMIIARKLSLITRTFQNNFINLTCVAENLPIHSKVWWKRYNIITNQVTTYKTMYCNNNTTCQTLLLLPFKDEYNQNVLECLVELRTDDIPMTFREVASEKILLEKPLVAENVNKGEKNNITGSDKVTSVDKGLGSSSTNTVMIVVSVIVIIIIAALIYSFFKCRRKIKTKVQGLTSPKDQGQIYATPEVHYAALDLETFNGSQPVAFEKAQYTQIVGVLKPSYRSNSNSDNVCYTVPVIKH